MFKIIVLVSGSGTNMLQLIKNNIKIKTHLYDTQFFGFCIEETEKYLHF